MDEKLNLLKTAIQKIQKKESSDLSFEELYMSAYWIVFLRQGERLYNDFKELVTHHLQQEVREDVLGSLNSNNFLQTLNQTWTDHQTSLTMIRRIFMYMDRVYVPQDDVDNVFDLGLILFHDEIISNERIGNHLRDTLLAMIMNVQNGEAIDLLQIKSACQMLMILGVDSRRVYEEYFERSFLEQSAAFYAMESQKLLSENNVGVYIKKVEACISEEAKRTKLYLDESTEQRIVEVVKREMIEKHMSTMVDMDFAFMLRNRMTESLEYMYKLFSRFTNGTKTIFERACVYLREQGTAFIKADGNPIKCVQNLLDLKDQLDHFLMYSFEFEKTLKRKISSEFEYFMKLNSQMPEYLSLFINAKLVQKSKSMSEQETDSILDKTMVLFRFLEEKDVFERYYKMHLAKRLLLKDLCVSYESERSMLSKLKAECGSQFTSKLEEMFNDMQVSKTILEEFKNNVHPPETVLSGISLSVSVLTTGSWPFKPSSSQCNIPIASQQAFDAFKSFYLAKHSGRQLTLQPHLGKATITAVFCDPKQTRKHELIVPTYLMCILMLFNKYERLTYEEIRQETEIPEIDLINALQSLSMGKQRVLMRTPATKDIEPTNEFYVNDSFSSKLKTVKIQMVAAKRETEPECRETREKVNEDRKYEIEAAIIRIMKSKKTMAHNLLVSEVIALLSSRFLPSPEMIKIRIQGLIEREYLAPTEKNSKVYSYIA